MPLVASPAYYNSTANEIRDIDHWSLYSALGEELMQSARHLDSSQKR